MKKCFIFAVLVMCLFFSGCEEAVEVSAPPHKVMREMPFLLPYDAKELESLISQVTEKAPGDWSVHVEIPGEDFVITLNNKVVRAASTIKMFNLATLYNEAEKGNIIITEKLFDTAYEMITVSSNTASNRIVSAIGGGSFSKGAKTVTDFAHENKFYDTQEQHPLYDVSGPASGINTTSVSDCASFLKKLYSGKLVSETADKKITDVLKEQKINHKIPATLPEGTVIAHKTGENSKVELDAAIVYSPACDYILCISVKDFRGREIHSTFSKISETVYYYFNRQY